MVCRGKGCSVTFQNVLFRDSCLVVIEGAEVSLAESSFTITQPSHEAQGLNLFCHGEGTTVKVNDVTIDGGVQSAAVHRGASLEAEGLQCSGCTFAGASTCMQSCTSMHLTSALVPPSDGSHIALGRNRSRKQ